MEKKNPFAIRKSPVELISAQAINLEDYNGRQAYSCGITGTPDLCDQSFV